jgi:hypothetical protein
MNIEQQFSFTKKYQIGHHEETIKKKLLVSRIRDFSPNQTHKGHQHKPLVASYHLDINSL